MKPQFTIEAFADFCAKKPANEKYDYGWPRACACGQFFASLGIEAGYAGLGQWASYGNPISASLAFDNAAKTKPHTFGALATRLRASPPR